MFMFQENQDVLSRCFNLTLGLPAMTTTKQTSTQGIFDGIRSPRAVGSHACLQVSVKADRPLRAVGSQSSSA